MCQLLIECIKSSFCFDNIVILKITHPFNEDERNQYLFTPTTSKKKEKKGGCLVWGKG